MCSKSINTVNWDLAAVYRCCTGTSNHCESLMHNVHNENSHWDDSFTTKMLARGGSEFLWAGSILAIFSCHKLWIWAVFTTFVAKRFTNFKTLFATDFTHAMTIAGMPERVVWVVYFVPTMRPVTSSTKGSYRYRSPPFHGTNCSPASLECFL